MIVMQIGKILFARNTTSRHGHSLIVCDPLLCFSRTENIPITCYNQRVLPSISRGCGGLISGLVYEKVAVVIIIPY